MKFKVYLTAFGQEDPPKERMVEVPDEELREDNIQYNLDRVFHYGQNDFQFVEGCYSVSGNDVIEYKEELYLVGTISGFIKEGDGKKHDMPIILMEVGERQSIIRDNFSYLYKENSEKRIEEMEVLIPLRNLDKFSNLLYLQAHVKELCLAGLNHLKAIATRDKTIIARDKTIKQMTHDQRKFETLTSEERTQLKKEAEFQRLNSQLQKKNKEIQAINRKKNELQTEVVMLRMKDNG